MDRSPLHPLRLLPALLATADQGRRHFESEIEQWLAEQAGSESGAAASGAEAGTGQGEETSSAGDHPAIGTPNVPPVGETIPKAGQ